MVTSDFEPVYTGVGPDPMGNADALSSNCRVSMCRCLPRLLQGFHLLQRSKGAEISSGQWH